MVEHQGRDHVIERAVVLGPGPDLRREDLSLSDPTGNSSIDGLDLSPGPFHEKVEEFKRALIRSALNASRGNQTRAAESLELQRTYLARLIRNLGLRDD